MNIRCALIGMPGSGKSTVGEHLAQRAGVPFVDLDHRLEQELGISIRQFFETEGEARFRDKEAAILAIMASMPGINAWRHGSFHGRRCGVAARKPRCAP